ncbi:MAG: hypothetical protein DI536_12425 [Archangium gephyra]|uniref:Lipoprotein n=1 Tax=Archangium gephyra TaxID=48 RepID=A0A2W5VSI1_9BACT|nr:MAG: hypothetical protein DI536_12425 [Archangium gephyra]
MNRVIVLAALVLAACGEICPDVLHIPVLTFELPEAEATAFDQAPCVVTTCLDDTCWEGTANPSNSLITWNVDTRRLQVEQRRVVNGTSTIVRGAPSSDVSLSASRDGGVLFIHRWDDVPFDDGSKPGTSCSGPETSEVLRF